jgi:hypothetical protein
MQWQYLQHPQIQASGNEVQAFVRTDNTFWQQHLHAELLEHPAFIMGMTDGVADDLEPPPSSSDPFVYIDEFKRAIMKDVVRKPEVEDAFVQFLGYQKKQSFDDRTVVCFYRDPGE